MENRSASSFKIYVVSLINQERRRAAIKKQLDEIDVNWEFFDAIDCQVSKATLDSFCDGAENIAPRLLSPGEVACAASHSSLYKRICEDQVSFALILEDDAIIGREAKDFLSAISISGTPNFDVLIVGYSKLSRQEADRFYIFEPTAKLSSVGNVSIGVPWKNWTCGTVGYIVSRQGAKKLLSRKVLTLADDWAGYERSFDLRILHARPLLVFEDFENLESSLHGARRDLQNPQRKYLDVIRFARGYARYFLIGTAAGQMISRFSGCRRRNSANSGGGVFLKN